LAHLARACSHGKPVEFVHLGVHGSEQGLAFKDGVMSWDWLSVALDGVEVLLLAACLSSKVGDWLGVVPHVVSMSEGVENEDAARFAQLFWMEMGRGASP